MSRLKYDYSTVVHIVDALGGVEALEAVKAQAEGMELPACPFCGGEAVVTLESAYGQPTVCIECDRCHSRTVVSGPGYDCLTEKMTDMRDTVNDVARRWRRRKESVA